MHKELELIGLESAKAESLELVISLFLNGNLSDDSEESLRLFGHYTIGLADKINHYWEKRRRIEGLNQVDRVKDVISRIAALRENTYTSQTIKNKETIQTPAGEVSKEAIREAFAPNTVEFTEELNTAQEESLDNSLAIPPIFDRRHNQEIADEIVADELAKEEVNQCRICGATSVKRDICGECQELGYEDDSDDNDSDNPNGGQGAALQPEQPINPKGSPPDNAVPLDDMDLILNA